MMCMLKEYNNIFLRRYLLERYRIFNGLEITQVEFRMSISLKSLTSLKFILVLKELEEILRIKLNYFVREDSEIEVVGKVYDVWEFLNSFYNYYYVEHVGEVEQLKYGYNVDNFGVIDVALRSWIGIPARVSLKYHVGSLVGEVENAKELVPSFYKGLGFYL